MNPALPNVRAEGLLKERMGGVNEFLAVKKEKLTTLQVNMGNLCNQSCLHCHIEASPQGKNIMPKKVADDILKFISKYDIETLDITGGAAELNPNFEYLITNARQKAKEIIVRSNLTVFFEPGKSHLPEFFRANRIHLICSLPCYTQENVEAQRGRGVFAKSISALKLLNDLGYSRNGGLNLDLVYNPTGAYLPPAQDELEQAYRQNLSQNYGINFNRLLTITNVPIKRFKNQLKSQGQYDRYTQLLKENLNPDVFENIMCTKFLSVGFDGKLYACDFNQALGWALKDNVGNLFNIGNFDADDFTKTKIMFGEHCFACVAGSGSSCQGALDTSPQNNIREGVKNFYLDAALQPKKELCCPISYEKEDVSYIPKQALEVSYGCGSPVTLAQPKEGEVMVDLGCGAGIDCFIAAKKVGITGRIIGVDMTEEMLNKARLSCEEVARNLGFLNCEFRQGFLEDIPVESETADLITSNCVVNLSYDKRKVFAEVYRILKKAGRFVISDIVSEKEVPADMKNNKKLWGECISGALTQNEFLTTAKEAGFYGLEILKNFLYREVEGIKFCSITVRGYKLKKQKSDRPGSCCVQGQNKGKPCC